MFSPKAARDLREGRKWMTRRKAWAPISPPALEPRKPSMWQDVRPGMRLWVREPFRGSEGYERMNLSPAKWGNKPVWYEADGTPPPEPWWFLSKRVRPARIMPRWMSRTTLLVTAVRIERIQEISEADCIAEGCERHPIEGWVSYETYPDGSPHPHAVAPNREARTSFREMWNSLHGPGAWEANPEVSVLTFDVILRNIDEKEPAA